MKNSEQTVTKKEITITLNKKAFHEYEILQKYEAGIALLGTEVKSIRVHKANIGDAYARMKDGELWLINSNIPAYKFGNINNHAPLRDRKLLLHKTELRKIETKLKDKGLTLIPLKMYFLGAKAKIEIGIAKGKRLYDKRESIKKADMQRQLKRIRSEIK
jgi:SsrA-binding protein